MKALIVVAVAALSMSSLSATPLPRPRQPLAKYAPATLEAEVIEVKDGQLVVAIGKDRGVRPGMTFRVYRLPPFYLGDLELVTVGDSQSVGRFQGLLGRPVRKGDLAGWWPKLSAGASK